jgi:glycyl-tRNA synthetase
MNLSKPLLLE